MEEMSYKGYEYQVNLKGEVEIWTGDIHPAYTIKGIIGDAEQFIDNLIDNPNSPVKVTIIENKGWPVLTYEVRVKVTPEFLGGPSQLISDEEKAEVIAQRIKKEFYKLLTTE